MSYIAEILNAAPDYSHLDLKESSVTVTLTKEEKEAILTAYDRGIERSDTPLILSNPPVCTSITISNED